ncbi:MAG: hypothetical protein M0Z44_03170 [Gammaproteobacteria bacterium]|nr:hypothetical protein [Gammaproteobacteria bacterium]
MRRLPSDLVVKRRLAAEVRYGVAVALVVLLIGGSYGLYTYGERVAGFNADAARVRASHLHQRIGSLRSQRRRLVAQLAAAHDTIQADAAAYSQLTGALKESNRKIAKLQEQVGFYQAVLDAPPRHGVQIDHFRVYPAASGYQYHLVLIQSFAFHRWLNAAVRLTVQGTIHGRPSVWSDPSLVDKPLYVHFKYFSDLHGGLMLPAGFVPSQVIVEVTSGGHMQKRSYAWPTAGTRS